MTAGPPTTRLDRLFLASLSAFLGIYVLLVLAMLVADATFTTPAAHDLGAWR